MAKLGLPGQINSCIQYSLRELKKIYLLFNAKLYL